MKKMIVYGFVLAGALILGCRTGNLYIGDFDCYHSSTIIMPVTPPRNGDDCFLIIGGDTPAPAPQQQIFPMAPTPSGLLGPAHQNVYGPGTWSDSTGRPFHWQTQDGQRLPLGNVKPDAFGPGIGMDEYGRPVKAVPGN